VLCVPGGSGTTEAMIDEAFMAEIRRLASGARYLTSVCTGSLILGAAGMLRGKGATTHWATHDLLARHWRGAGRYSQPSSAGGTARQTSIEYQLVWL
jgi:putative intracellular protease/amidase